MAYCLHIVLNVNAHMHRIKTSRCKQRHIMLRLHAKSHSLSIVSYKKITLDGHFNKSMHYITYTFYLT